MTDEMIKDIYKDDDIYDLVLSYLSSRKTANKQNAMRALLIILVIFFMYYVLLCALFYLLDYSSIYFLIAIIPSAIAAFFHFLIHWSIFHWLISRGIEEDNRIISLEKRIRFAQERIRSMDDKDISALIAKKLWYYTEQIVRQYSIDREHIVRVWTVLLYACHTLLDKHDLTCSVELSILLDIPSDYDDMFNTNEECLDCYDSILYLFKSFSNHFSKLNVDVCTRQGAHELLSFIVAVSPTTNDCTVSRVDEFYDMLIDINNRIQAIFNARKPTYQGPQFPGPIPG